MDRQDSYSTGRTIWIVAALALQVGITPARGALPTVSIALTDERVAIARLLPDDGGTPELENAGQATFTVDDATVVHFDIVSNIAGLTTEIDYPGAPAPLGPTTVHTIAGWYRDFEVQDNPDPSCLFLPTMCEPGFHYVYELPSQGPGNYTVSFTAPPDLGGESEGAVIVRFDSDSPVAVGMMTAPRTAHAGRDVTIVAYLFEDDVAVTDAPVTALIWRPDADPDADSPDSVTLLDDGVDPDMAAGDGLYSGVYQVAAGVVGAYVLRVDATGTTLSGKPFVRQATASIEAYEPEAVFAATLNLDDNGQDDDSPPDGLYDRLEISAAIDVRVAGDFELTAVLETPTTGQTMVAIGRAENLVVASGVSIHADIPANEMLEFDEWGTYAITELRLSYIDQSAQFPGPREVDERHFEPAINTDAYTRIQFDRPPIEIRDAEITSTAVDTTEPANGLYDELRFSVPMDLRYAGTYTYIAYLSAPCDGDGDSIVDAYAVVDTVSGEWVVGSGQTNPATLELVFDGSLIGQLGVDGPYRLEDLVLSGPASLITAVLADTTTAYQASQFEQWSGRPDCDTDGLADACNMALDPAADCDGNGVLDTCESPTLGACCDVTTGACTDGISTCQCIGRFVQGETCATLDPPCGFACCKSDGTCIETTPADCDLAGGVHTPGSTCAEVGCFASCFNKDHCCFQSSPGPGIDGCNDTALCNAVCQQESYCCEGLPTTQWDSACAALAVYTVQQAPFNKQAPLNCNDNVDANNDPFYDVCEILIDASKDCNLNETLDECDIASSDSTDCNSNGVPDECEPGACCDWLSGGCLDDVVACDCIGTFEAGATCATLTEPCAFACCQVGGVCTDETAADCNSLGGVLAVGVTCGDPGFSCSVCAGCDGACYASNGTPGCANDGCTLAVCQYDGFCCSGTWDALCAEHGVELRGALLGVSLALELGFDHAVHFDSPSTWTCRVHATRRSRRHEGKTGETDQGHSAEIPERFSRFWAGCGGVTTWHAERLE